MSTMSETLPTLTLQTDKIAISYTADIFVWLQPEHWNDVARVLTFVPCTMAGLVVLIDDRPGVVGCRQLAGYTLWRPAVLELQIPLDVTFTLEVQSGESMYLVRTNSDPWVDVREVTRQHADHG